MPANTENDGSPAAVSTRRAWPRLLLGGAVALALGAAVGWAAAVVFTPANDVLTEASFTYVKLVDGEVGSSITLNTTAAWEREPVGSNKAAGTVTSVSVRPGDEVKAGQVLYVVNLRPVVVAQGTTPSFRSLSQGSKGEDVKQLQGLLASLDLYSGEVDGEFGTRTEQAVRKWQDSLDLEEDGVVQPGDLVFVPALPGRVALDDEVVFRGAVLTGGEVAVSGLTPEPSFSISATPKQAAMMPAGTKVELNIDDATWIGVVAGQEWDPEAPDIIRVMLTGEGGGSVCGDSCGLIPVIGESLLTSKIVTQASVSGVLVPSAALLSELDGNVSVVDEVGKSHPVSVVASAQGMSVIEGVEIGMRVRIPADGAAAQ